MRGFPGQITCLGLQGTQATVWTFSVGTFFLKSFQIVTVRTIGFFQGLIR